MRTRGGVCVSGHREFVKNSLNASFMSERKRMCASVEILFGREKGCGIYIDGDLSIFYVPSQTCSCVILIQADVVDLAMFMHIVG